MNAITKTESPARAVVKFDDDQIGLIKRTIAKGATDDELKLFLYQCERTGLDPLARQIYAVKRWDGAQNREVMGIQTSIDGFRLIAERSGHYAGQVGPFWCGDDGNWVDVWLSSTTAPKAAKVGVLRDDFKEPCWGVARFDGYAQQKKGGGLTKMWSSMGDVMVAKCAEALALRKAFPQELSGLYTGDEMMQATQGADDHPETVVEQPRAPTKQEAVAVDVEAAVKRAPEPVREPVSDGAMSPREWARQTFFAVKDQVLSAETQADIDAVLKANKDGLKNLETASAPNFLTLKQIVTEKRDELKGPVDGGQ